jgi:hypothetical protein
MLSCQTPFNYVINGNFQNNTCTSSALSLQYNCYLNCDPSSNWNWGSGGDSLDLEYGYAFYSTSTSSIVASLDRYLGGSFIPSYIISSMHPISAGTYRLSFTAYTRKTGVASDYYFYLSIYDHSFNYFITNKTYSFSSLGAMPITETITFSAPPTGNGLYLKLASKTIASSLTPFAPGISDVKFERISSCNGDETSVVLTTGETICILNHTILSTNYCTSWNYYHWYKPTGAIYEIRKFFGCSSCSSGKLVGVIDFTLLNQNTTLHRYKYGCTIN